jgi:hypothetical protein
MLIILEVQFISWYLHFGNSKVSISKSNGECLDSLACCFYFSTTSPVSSHFFLSGESADLGQQERKMNLLV